MFAFTAKKGRIVGAAAITALLAGTVAACGDSQDTAQTTSPADAEAALSEESSLLVWGWDPAIQPVADAFEAKYPNIDVEVVNVGTGSDHYTKVQNAITASSGAPDLAQMEYYAIPQFALSGGLADLTALGAGELESSYTPAAWNNVVVNDAIYGLPWGTGPMALFYNKAVFDEHGVEVPGTWDEYVAAAKTLHEADPDLYITNDAGDAGFATSMMWQAGGQPFQIDGTNVSVNLQDEGSMKWANTWNELVQNDLVAPISSWSDEWYQGLSNGSIASLTIGAWMAGNLESGVPDGAGDWRVAPMPVWNEGDTTTAENGGGAFSVLEQSDNKVVAQEFLEFMTASSEGQKITLDTVDGIPSTVAELSDEQWLNREWEYFGGQQVNQVLADAANNVVEGWQYLPFQVFANSVFADSVGQSYANKSDINAGLSQWQDAIVSYGEQQGFEVSAQ
ncbi:ABC transporter substrate-binding protein [Jonesia quinghaiensis]|uniref:ABC transporter substrate-binding protein n=1 Tax=Jonesia quinghaiensis TaxID=262806 RepID=UPI0004055875|nr:sugar ABC transporter substrate-binding protein [Jonesia quinghaiensis]